MVGGPETAFKGNERLLLHGALQPPERRLLLHLFQLAPHFVFRRLSPRLLCLGLRLRRLCLQPRLQLRGRRRPQRPNR
jgi:hypothetical protein